VTATPNAADERRLASGALKVLGALALPVAGLAFLASGVPGAVSALIGLALVLVLFGASALLLAWVAEHASASFLGVLVGGLLVRLGLYAATLMALSTVSWVHRQSLAGATALGVAVTLGYELVLLHRSPRLFWVDAAAARPSATSNATRSRSL
jgi:hypothetical protein